jgi:hypothetical protein
MHLSRARTASNSTKIIENDKEVEEDPDYENGIWSGHM